jgi:dihydrofolate synthase/folylpolyglutamate synthase
MQPAPSGFSYCAGDFLLEKIALSLKGRFQAVNAAAAVTAARLLGDARSGLPTDAVRKGLAQAFWPGRLELLADGPKVLLDGAHNPAGAAALRESLPDFSYKRLFLVVGMMADKDWQSVLLPLLPLATAVIAVQPALERALSAEELAGFCTAQGIESFSANSVMAGIDRARGLAAADDLILVSGSLFTVGEARAAMTGTGFMPIRG